MTVRRAEEMKTMDTTSNEEAIKANGSVSDDVVSLNSFCELDMTGSGTQQQQHLPATPQARYQSSNVQKQNSSSGRSRAPRKSRSKSVVVTIKTPSNTNISSTSSGGSGNLNIIHSGKSEDSPRMTKTSRYSGNDNPVLLSPDSLRHEGSSTSEIIYPQLPLEHSQSADMRQLSSSKILTSSLRAGPSTVQVKKEYLHHKSLSNPGDVMAENVVRSSKHVNVNPSKVKAEQQYRSTDDIYSSSEHAHSSSHRSSGNEFGGDLDQLLEQSEKVKTKLLSMWNNMKYGWTIKMKTQFRIDSPIYILGKCYHIRKEEDVETDTHQPQHHHPQMSYRMTEMEEFKRDFTSRIWFTYRRDFPQLPGSTFTTDCGWGCMLRSGQMMLAQAFVDHFLTRDWRLFNYQTHEQELYHRQIINWFGDHPSEQSPFSVHSLVQLGEKAGKHPGDWYGPASISYILKEAISLGYESQPILNDIAIYVSQDCTVYKQDVMNLCTRRSRLSSHMPSSSKESTSSPAPEQPGNLEWKRGVVLLIPVRLGGDSLNPVYIPCVKSLLSQDYCIGIIGGKPKHSLYFVGWQEDKLIHLDPHYCQDFVDTQDRNFTFASYHCMSPRKMAFSKMDPSCTVGFYCKTKAEFDKFVEQTKEMVLEPKCKGLYPMFIFSEGSSADVNISDLSLNEDRFLRVRHVNTTTTARGKPRTSTIESEEFVFL